MEHIEKKEDFGGKKIKSTYYPSVIKYLRRLIGSEFGKEAELARFLGTKTASFNTHLNFISIVNADEFCMWLEKLGCGLFLPGETPPCPSTDHNIEIMQEKINYLNKLLETNEQLVRVLTKNQEQNERLIQELMKKTGEEENLQKEKKI